MKRWIVPHSRADSSSVCVPYTLFFVNEKLFPKLLSTCVCAQEDRRRMSIANLRGWHSRLARLRGKVHYGVDSLLFQQMQHKVCRRDVALYKLLQKHKKRETVNLSETADILNLPPVCRAFKFDRCEM